jgi:hypothetical protein
MSARATVATATAIAGGAVVRAGAAEGSLDVRTTTAPMTASEKRTTAMRRRRYHMTSLLEAAVASAVSDVSLCGHHLPEYWEY